jgi:hypothetical protein
VAAEVSSLQQQQWMRHPASAASVAPAVLNKREVSPALLYRSNSNNNPFACPNVSVVGWPTSVSVTNCSDNIDRWTAAEESATAIERRHGSNS